MTIALMPADGPVSEEDLWETDGEPLDSDWHRMAINLMCDVISQHLRHRHNYFVGGNMFLYFSAKQVRNKDYRGPDFFFVDGIPDGRRDRRYWATWLEGNRFPNMITELLSETTAKIDRTVKKKLYERTFRTPQYFCYDPDTQVLEGWRLGPTCRYRSIKANAKGWLWSEQLNLWLGTWEGEFQLKKRVWLRFYDKNERLVFTFGEAEGRRAAKALRRLEEQRKKAEAAEAEAVRLREELEKLRKPQRGYGKK